MRFKKLAKAPSTVNDKYRYFYNTRVDRLETLLRIVTPISFAGTGFGASGLVTFTDPKLIMWSWIIAGISILGPIMIYGFARKFRKIDDKLHKKHESAIQENVVDSISVYGIENFKLSNLRLAFRVRGNYNELWFAQYHQFEVKNPHESPVYKGYLTFEPFGDCILMDFHSSQKFMGAHADGK